MEASSPKVWAEKFLEAEVDRLVALTEKELANAQLSVHFQPHVSVNIPCLIMPRVGDAFTARYVAAGWSSVLIRTNFYNDGNTLVSLYLPSDSNDIEELVHESILNEGVNVVE